MAKDWLDDLAEFGRMGGREKNADPPFGSLPSSQSFPPQITCEPKIGDRTVRIQQVTVFLIHTPDRGADFVVAVPGSNDVVAHRVHIVAVQPPHAFEVAR